MIPRVERALAEHDWITSQRIDQILGERNFTQHSARTIAALQAEILREQREFI
jgi:hypothetical protein